MLVGIAFGEILGFLAFSIALLILLGTAGYLSHGLFEARSLIRREFSAYFLSPIAYVILVAFLVVTGYLFWLTLNGLTESGPKGSEWPLQMMFGNPYFWLVFLFVPPVLTMRLFAEERSTGTLEMLMTAPLRDWQVVLCKYVACFAFYLVLLLPTVLYLPVLLGWNQPEFNQSWTVWSILGIVGIVVSVISALSFLPSFGTVTRAVSTVAMVLGLCITALGIWGHYKYDEKQLVQIVSNIDAMPVVSSYLGLALAGAMFLALGMLMSSLVRSQIVAAILTAMLSLVFIILGIWRPDLDTGNVFYRILYFFTIPLHFSQDFTRGVVDTRHLVLYASVTSISLFLTVRSLESRRWR